MDREKVIRLIEEEIGVCESVDQCYRTIDLPALRDILALLKELVRCKDCKHGSIYMTEDVCGKTLIECNHPELGDNIAIHAWDWFCADGERK